VFASVGVLVAKRGVLAERAPTVVALPERRRRELLTPEAAPGMVA
jgi:hypothetical protein